VKKVTSILLSFILVISTTGFTINKHFCGGHLVATQFFSTEEPESCCDGMDMPAGCCHNESEYYQLDENFNLAKVSFETASNFVFTFIKHIVLNDLFASTDTYKVKYLHYKPPLLKPDIPVLIQSFLL